MNPAELAWLAGFLDGEGCIGIYKHKTNISRGHQLRVSVTNTDLPSLLKFKHAFGGGLWEQGRKGSLGNKPCWEWQATGPVAEAALRQLMPYLVTKAPQAHVAIRFRQTFGNNRRPRGSRGRHTLPENVLASRVTCARELSAMKR